MVSWKFLASAAGRDVLTSAPSPHAGPSFCDCLVEEEAGNFDLRMPARLTVSPTASLGSTQSPLRLAPQEVTAKTKRWPFPVGMLSNFQVICNPVIFLSCPNGILAAPAPSWCRFVSLSTRLKARNCLCNDLAIGAAFACMVCALGVSGRVFVRLPVFVVLASFVCCSVCCLCATTASVYSCFLSFCSCQTWFHPCLSGGIELANRCSLVQRTHGLASSRTLHLLELGSFVNAYI